MPPATTQLAESSIGNKVALLASQSVDADHLLFVWFSRYQATGVGIISETLLLLLIKIFHYRSAAL